jgi:putative PIN family toxin of toxin-antitoxin system
MKKTTTPRVTMTLALDTNVVLDWLVFEDACMDVLRKGTLEGCIAVITHPPALHELKRVLTYPQFKLDATMQKEVLETYVALFEIATLPDGFSLEHLMLPAGFPRCRDRDDEHFLALAYHSGADALVSKDKDLLRVRKRAGRFGVKVLSVPQLTEMFHQLATEPAPQQAPR